MTGAVAIFVKTPGLSPVKTRLAAVLGTAAATHFYQLAATATAEVARHCQPVLVPYWAIAESGLVASAAWTDFAQVGQGDGGLGERLHRVYAELQARHGRVLLIGADAPQLTAATLCAALATLDRSEHSFVLGDAEDGGFWLFGGSVPIPKAVWRTVRYSQSQTASDLRDLLRPYGLVADMPVLADVDHASDLPSLARALADLPEPVPAQRTLLAWVQAVVNQTLHLAN